MPDQVTLYRVFVASPGGLEQERALFRQTLQEYNESEALDRGAMFVPIGWELTLPGTGRPQELINKDLRACDYFMLLLWDRWGSPTEAGSSPRFASGVEEEFSIAQECMADEKGTMRDLVVLFKAVDHGKLADPGPQLSKVIDFKKSLEGSKQLLFATFDNGTLLQQHIRRCLGQWLREIGKNSDRQATRVRWHRTEANTDRASFIGLPDESSQNPVLRNARKLADSGRLVEAETEFARALISTGSREAFVRYGEFLIRLGRLSQARILLEEARAKGISDHSSLSSECLRALGNIDLLQGNLDSAMALFESALEIDQRSGNRAAYALDQEYLGRLSNIRGEPRKARELYESAAKISESLGDLASVARLRKFLADMLRHEGQLADAEQIYLKSLQIFERLGLLSEIASVEGSLGLLALVRHDHDFAEKAFRKALEIEQKLGRAEGIARQYSHLGMVARAQNRLDEAASYFSRSLEINAANGFMLGSAVVCRHIGTLHLKRGELDQAEQMYRRAMDSNERLGSVEGLANCYFDLGRIYKRRGELNITRALWEKSKELYESIGVEYRAVAMTGRLEKLDRTLQRQSTF